VSYEKEFAKLNASEEDATQSVLALAAGKLDDAGYSAWLREPEPSSRVTRGGKSEVL
jgi:hypothetical protein